MPDYKALGKSFEVPVPLEKIKQCSNAFIIMLLRRCVFDSTTFDDDAQIIGQILRIIAGVKKPPQELMMNLQ